MSVAIARAGAERVDELEPLWLALHRHHREVSAQPEERADIAKVLLLIRAAFMRASSCVVGFHLNERS